MAELLRLEVAACLSHTKRWIKGSKSNPINRQINECNTHTGALRRGDTARNMNSRQANQIPKWIPKLPLTRKSSRVPSH